MKRIEESFPQMNEEDKLKYQEKIEKIHKEGKYKVFRWAHSILWAIIFFGGWYYLDNYANYLWCGSFEFGLCTESKDFLPIVPGFTIMMALFFLLIGPSAYVSFWIATPIFKLFYRDADVESLYISSSVMNPEFGGRKRWRFRPTYHLKNFNAKFARYSAIILLIIFLGLFFYSTRF